MKKLTVNDFNQGKTEIFSLEKKDGSFFIVSMYKDLGNYFVSVETTFLNIENKVYSFGSLSQARKIFNDKVKIGKVNFKKEE